MEVNSAILSASRWAGFAQGANQASQLPISSTDNNAVADTGQDKPDIHQAAPAADSQTLSVKTVFRQQTALSLQLEKVEHADDPDRETAEVEDAEKDDEKHADISGSLRASFSQSYFNVINMTRQTALPAESESMQSVDDDAEVTEAESSAQPATAGNITASRQLDSSLQLTTAEGDVVSVEFTRSQSVTAGNVNTETSSTVYAGASSSSQISIQIGGDLNKKESNAIENVIKRVTHLAEKLFDGKSGAALGQLQSLDVNTKQLSAIALDIFSSYSYASVSQYNQVGALSDPAANDAAPVVDSSPGAGDAGAVTNESTPVAVTDAVPQDSAAALATQAVQDTKQVVDDAVDAEVFDNPFAEIRKLFASIADSFAAMNQAISEQQNDFIKQLFSDVVDKVESDRESEADDDDVEDTGASDLLA